MSSEELRGLSDDVLIFNVKEHSCSESFLELSRRYSNLFYGVCQKFSKVFYSLGYNMDDIFEEKDYILLNSIKKYNPSKKSKFSTWFCNCSRYFCLNKINKRQILNSNADDAQKVFDRKSLEKFHDHSFTIDITAVVSALKEKCHNKKVSEIFQLRYDPDKKKKPTWENIARQLDISMQAALKLHKQGLSLLREEIHKKELDIFANK